MNKHIACLAALAALAANGIAIPAEARPSGGMGGGMSRGGGMARAGGAMAQGGGISRGGTHGGGMSRPVSRPTSAPSFSGSRPQVSRPQMSRPQVSRPSTGAASRPAVSRPTMPEMNRPSGGMIPSTRPSMPSMGNRPATRPGGAGGGTANRPSRPTTLPDFNLPSGGAGGGARPLPQRPEIGARPQPGRPGGGNRPSITPDRPGSRPGLAENRPGTRPTPGGNRPAPGGNRPAPGGTRPSPGDLGDFLGMQRPVRPDFDGGRPGGGAVTLPGESRPSILPGGRPGEGVGGIQRPSRPGEGGIERPTRPGGGQLPDRPGEGGAVTLPGRPGGGGAVTLPGRPDGGGAVTLPGRPGGGGAVTLPGRPGQGGGEQWRPGGGNRPWRPDGWDNNHIHQRPPWVNINNNTIININNNWTNVINRPGVPGWYRPRPEWTNHWNHWGSSVRWSWHHNHWHNNWFQDSWWVGRWGHWGGWHYGFRWGFHPWTFWWTVPVWTNVNTWFTWGTPGAAAWQQPIYYNYGSNGNVVFRDDNVYIGGQQVASTSDFAQSAAALATVDPPETEEQAEAAEWMPLGTFAVSTSEKETDPSRVMQLAVSREGIISGTLYNSLTDQTQEIQGKVDRDTQRAAFRIGASENVVAETGLYNLTQEEVQLLVHYGTDRTETILLVRLDAPEEGSEQAATP